MNHEMIIIVIQKFNLKEYTTGMETLNRPQVTRGEGGGG